MALGWEGSAGKLKGRCGEPEKRLDVLVKKPSNNHPGDKENEGEENKEKEKKEA